MTVTFEKDKLSDLLGLYNVIEIIDKIDKDIFTLEFDYYREKKWERRETNEKILKLFSENPSLQIPECAKILDMKYSYVYTSIAQLRKMGKLEHKQLDFTTEIWIVKQGGQA